MTHAKKISGLLRSIALSSTILLTPALALAGTISSEPYGKTSDGKDVELFTLTNDDGASVKFISYGGIITEINVPDRAGRLGNVVLGFKTLAEYETQNPYFGCITGRYANRIAKGKFSLDGTDYQLELNNDPNTLHGGKAGFDKRVWTVKPLEGAAAELTYLSPDGEEGYPGNLQTKVVYEWTDDAELKITYEATTDKPTVLNLTSHSYFNLAGDGSGSIEDHLLSINAAEFTPIDATGIPTGELRKVEGTPFDFRRAMPVGARLRLNDEQLVNGRGYDHNFVIDKKADEVAVATTLYDPSSGRALEISSDQPGLQLYTGNFLDGKTFGSAGRQYRQGDGIALETQHFPDSPNQDKFPSTRLDPGQTFKSVTSHRFFADID